MRPASSTCIVFTKPWPSAPSSWSAGIRQFSNSTSLVSLARMPSLSSFLPAVMPGVPFSMMNAEMPLVPAARSVTAIATSTSPTRPCVVNVFDPFSTQHAPARAAVVRMPAASLPEVDSVSPHAPIFSPRASGTRNLLLLRLGAEQEDVRRAQAVVRRDRQRDARIDARELLDADAVVDRRHAGAAVGLGKLDAQEPERGELRDELDRKVLRLVPLHHVRADLGFREFAHAAPEQRLFLGETKIHRLGARALRGRGTAAGAAVQSVCGARFSTSQP